MRCHGKYRKRRTQQQRKKWHETVFHHFYLGLKNDDKLFFFSLSLFLSLLLHLLCLIGALKSDGSVIFVISMRIYQNRFRQRLFFLIFYCRIRCFFFLVHRWYFEDIKAVVVNQLKLPMLSVWPNGSGYDWIKRSKCSI